MAIKEPVDTGVADGVVATATAVEESSSSIMAISSKISIRLDRCHSLANPTTSSTTTTGITVGHMDVTCKIGTPA
jgi:hypothetical protein